VIEMMIEEDTGAIDSSRILERFGNVPDRLDAMLARRRRAQRAFRLLRAP
jgi:hypothetical protein